MIVELTNIQSILSARYILEETGVTQIIGENSNGKSIVVKAMSFVANTHIKDEDKRLSLINDDKSTGIISMSRKGMKLKVTVTRERENCRYELIRANGEVITRTIREGGLEILSSEFGWTSFNGNICLQIFETYGVMPFVNNRESSDYEIIDSIITDKVANDFINSYEKVTYPEFKKYSSEMKSIADSATRELDGITFYDISKYEDILFKLKRYQRNVSNIHICNLERLPITKGFKYIKVDTVVLVRLPIYSVVREVPVLNTIHTEIDNYIKVINGVCPTCNTKLKDQEVCLHVS